MSREEIDEALRLMENEVSVSAMTALRGAMKECDLELFGGRGQSKPKEGDRGDESDGGKDGGRGGERGGETGEEAGAEAEGKGKIPDSHIAKNQLTAEQAIQIFQLRPRPANDGKLRRGSMMHCKVVAPKYGVTPKTIRDIWNGRTWWNGTKPYWSKQERFRKACQIMPDSATAYPTMWAPSQAGVDPGAMANAAKQNLPQPNPHLMSQMPAGGPDSLMFHKGVMSQSLPFAGPFPFQGQQGAAGYQRGMLGGVGVGGMYGQVPMSNESFLQQGRKMGSGGLGPTGL